MSESALPDVSRETQRKLECYVATLTAWAPRINLVSKATLADVWDRHIADSLQLRTLAPPGPLRWLDFGSGAGLPGLILAATDPELRMTLVESDVRKCAFMRTAAIEMGVSVEILNDRIENLAPQKADVISARAVAHLDTLLDYALPHCTAGTICLFPKGERVDLELTAAQKRWKMDVERIRSRTDSSASILRIGAFARA